MTPFSMNFVAGFAEVLTAVLVHFVWQGAVLTLILLGMLKLLDVKAARPRYLLSVATILLMGVAPLVTAMWHQQSHLPSRPSQTDWSQQASVVIEDQPAMSGSVSLNPELAEGLPTLSHLSMEVYLMMAWLAGVLFLSTRLAIGFGVTLWIRGQGKPLSEEFELRVRMLGERLGVDARRRVFACARVCQAVAVGFVRPIVLIPASWLTRLAPQMIEAIVAHELAHIRRWDLWVNLAQRVIETFLFYHPAVWWLSNRIRLEREMCCDEIAAECCDRLVYVRSLESVAKMARGNLLLATSINGGKKMNLLTRIRNLLERAPVDRTGNWWAVGFVALVLPFAGAIVLSLATVAGPSLAREDDEPAASNPIDKVAPTDKVVAAVVQSKAVAVPQRYVAKIQAHRHIEVRALSKGYLEAIPISEGQSVKQGDQLFAIKPMVYQSKVDAENAELKIAQVEYENTKRLFQDKVVSSNELAVRKAKLDKAQANFDLAQAELNFTKVQAPFGGVVGSLRQQAGSLVLEGDVLTTLSDNSALWVYFNVPEANYLEYMAEQKKHKEEAKVELILANGKKFDQVGKIKAIESGFNNATGTIAFRSDFPNPDGLLRHGQSGQVLVSRVQNDAIVIPKAAAFLAENAIYVYVLDKEGVAHQSKVIIQAELNDVYVIKNGVSAGDKIIVDGIKQVQDGQKVKYEIRPK